MSLISFRTLYEVINLYTTIRACKKARTEPSYIYWIPVHLIFNRRFSSYKYIDRHSACGDNKTIWHISFLWKYNNAQIKKWDVIIHAYPHSTAV